LVQNLGVEAGDAPLEDFTFPGICWGFKALDLANRFERAALAEELRARRHVLPVKQPIHELRGRDGLNFLSELTESQSMNAGKQAAFTPLV